MKEEEEEETESFFAPFPPLFPSLPVVLRASNHSPLKKSDFN
jgi:hypothetical protein